jgi:hypothetical protein
MRIDVPITVLIECNINVFSIIYLIDGKPSFKCLSFTICPDPNAKPPSPQAVRGVLLLNYQTVINR